MEYIRIIIGTEIVYLFLTCVKVMMGWQVSCGFEKFDRFDRFDRFAG